VRRVFEQGAWADRALRGEAERLGLDARERALATRLAYGTVQRRATLDHLIEAFAGRSTARLQPPVLAALRLGLLQLCFLDGIPARAAVDQSVHLARAEAPAATGLVNAVLRRAAREGRAMLAALGDETPEQAALKHSHPPWLAHMWWQQLGPQAARALLARDNEPAEAAVRVNTLRGAPEAVRAALEVETVPTPGLPEGLVLGGAFDVHGSAAFARGELMPQSRAAMRVARLLVPEPGQRVLDLCAAPGAKTTHLAALMRGEGEIVAVERHPGRAAALQRTAARMGAEDCVRVELGDAATARPPGDQYDRVLVDPPCSDLGTLQSRPDARWRRGPEDLTRLALLQGQILAVGAAALRPGGVLVYSVCTISAQEGEQVVAALLADRPELSVDDLRREGEPVWEHPRVPEFVQSLPHRDGTDGFFVARLRRSAP